MIWSTNPEDLIHFVDQDLSKMQKELREFSKVFGKHKQIDEACNAISKLKKAYKNWERIDISPASGKPLKVEAEEERERVKRWEEEHESNV